MHDLSVIIPTRNEEKTVAEVVRGCLKYSNEVIVVDGHSRDHTCEVALAAGARILHQSGLGKSVESDQN